MSGLTLGIRKAILRHVFRGEPMPEPPPALYAAAITPAGEVSAAGTGYARVRVVAEAWSEPDDAGAVTNVQELVFPVATGTYEDAVTALEFFDAAAGGTSWARGKLRRPVLIEEDDQLRIPSGWLTVALRERQEVVS